MIGNSEKLGSGGVGDGSVDGVDVLRDAEWGGVDEGQLVKSM